MILLNASQGRINSSEIEKSDGMAPIDYHTDQVVCTVSFGVQHFSVIGALLRTSYLQTGRF